MGGILSRSRPPSSEGKNNEPSASSLTFQRPPSSISPHNPDQYKECRTLLLKIRDNPSYKARLTGLEGEDAQNMVDFLSIVAYEQGILDHDEGIFLFSCLRNLVNMTRVFPRYYELRGINYHNQTEYGGAFSDVCIGDYQSQKLGIKMIRLSGEDKQKVLKMFVKELTLWAHLSHVNILPFYGVYLHHETKRICLVSPWMKNSNLHDYLHGRPETPRLLLISDIINGLLYLHKRKIVHGDLKATNVLISDGGHALIGDFGLSYIAVASGLTRPSEIHQGTSRWMAPELLRLVDETTRQTLESDVWSFSCLCYEVLTRKVPFYKVINEVAVYNLLATTHEIPTQPDVAEVDAEHDRIDPRMWAIMEKCWNYIPTERPTCESIHCDIAALNIQDDRPEAKTPVQNGLPFWQEMKANSGTGVNYSRVRDILLKIQLPVLQGIN